MNSFTLREYLPVDIPVLTALWRGVFGDPDALIASFFDLLPGMGTCLVAEQSGRLAGMASVICAMELVSPPASPKRCAYVYAVAVDGAARHQGIGAALVREASALAMTRGASLLSTLPAEPSLYAWYEELMGVSCALRRTRYETVCAPGLAVETLSAAEYMRRRESLLVSLPHLRLTGAAPTFAQCFYESFGGGLYACGEALCSAYVDGSTAYVKELVLPAGSAAAPSAVAASLGAALGASRARYWLPSQTGEAYISAVPGLLPPSCVWNLSFD